MDEVKGKIMEEFYDSIKESIDTVIAKIIAVGEIENHDIISIIGTLEVIKNTVMRSALETDQEGEDGLGQEQDT